MDKKVLSKVISFALLVIIFGSAMAVLNQSELELISEMSDTEKAILYTSDLDTSIAVNIFISLFFLGFLFGAYEIISLLLRKFIK